MNIDVDTLIIARSEPLDEPVTEVQGKFLFAGGQKEYLRGVTYGTFRPDTNGDEYPAPEVVESDFAMMVANGINAVRTYTPPPTWLLDAAFHHGLHVMPSLAVERFIGHMNDRGGVARICAEAASAFATIAGHPAIVCVSLGNEIPAATVRWLGAGAIEALLGRITKNVHETDRNTLVTYANYPSTEYLKLPFLDVVSFNVYLESDERFRAYVARLHQIAGSRPLLMTEIGLDSYRNGQSRQADLLRWQVRAAFEEGCAGTFVYSWTDEWHRGGEDVHDWEFGLTGRDRCAKPALGEIRSVYGTVPFLAEPALSFSVVVCAYNAASTIEECLRHATSLEYGDYEVIVIDDGSCDATAALAARYNCRVVSTENRGLSRARNLGLELAQGDIVAYLDSDAYPDRHWLAYLAHSFTSSDVAGVGGPNIPPSTDLPLAHCVANAPGGPCEVLLDDRVAEHIPGCNMAFRRDVLQRVGGCDERFRSAGDDVDLCWRVQDDGGVIGFHPAAVVWHHRRSSLRAYWRQQIGYGRAEALLEAKWPARYNTLGHLRWQGRIYGLGATSPLRRVTRVYQGIWGLAPFQSLYERSPGTVLALPLMAEWIFVPLGLSAISLIGFAWTPMFLALVPAVVATLPMVVQSIRSARRASFPRHVPHARLLRFSVALLHLAQPVARLKGRFWHGLHPLRWRGPRVLRLPYVHSAWLWSEDWTDPVERLGDWERRLTSSNVIVRRNSDFDRWDLEVRCGPCGRARVLMAVEEHGAGTQLVRWRIWPVWSKLGTATAAVFAAGGLIAAHVSGVLATGLIIGASAVAGWCAVSCAASVGAFVSTAHAGMATEGVFVSPADAGTATEGVFVSPAVAATATEGASA